MLRLLQSIFGYSPETPSSLDDELIERAIERVIDGTDPRLRLVSSYAKALRDPVVCAVEHTIELVDALPEPIELSSEQFGNNELVRALFVSPDHLNDVLLRSRTLKDYLDTRSGLEPENIHALLMLIRSERNVLGMKLEGEMVRNDVAQISINFSNHQLLGPMDSESESRVEQMKRVFDYFIKMALRDIVDVRSEQNENRLQQELLAKKLRTLEKANWSLESVLNSEQEKSVDLQELESQIAELEKSLHASDSTPITLDQYLEIIANSLKNASEQLKSEVITLKMDRMRIKAGNAESSSIITLQLQEVSSSDGHKMIALPVYIPFASIPSRPDFVTEASRYL